MEIKPIRNEGDYERALHRLEELFDAPRGSAEGDELDVWATLMEAYEREHFPMDLPDPVAAIQFRLEQQGKDSWALVGLIGGRTRVYEVLQGKRPLSLSMIRTLHQKLGIPADVLIRPARPRRKPRRTTAPATRRGARRVRA